MVFIIYSSDSSSDSFNFKPSLTVFTIFLSFIAYLHSSKNIWGQYSLFELRKIESNNITHKHAQYSYLLVFYYVENLYILYHCKFLL